MTQNISTLITISVAYRETSIRDHHNRMPTTVLSDFNPIDIINNKMLVDESLQNAIANWEDFYGTTLKNLENTTKTKTKFVIDTFVVLNFF